MLQVCLITTKYSFLSQVKQNCKDGDRPGFHYPLPCLPPVPRAGCGTPTTPASTEDSPGHQEMEEKGQARGTGMQSEAQATHTCRVQRTAFSQGGTEASKGGKKLGTGPLAEKGHGKMKRLGAPYSPSVTRPGDTPSPLWLVPTRNTGPDREAGPRDQRWECGCPEHVGGGGASLGKSLFLTLSHTGPRAPPAVGGSPLPAPWGKKKKLYSRPSGESLSLCFPEPEASQPRSCLGKQRKGSSSSWGPLKAAGWRVRTQGTRLQL